MRKTVRLGNRLRYPITIGKLLKSSGDKIEGQEAVFEYSYKWTREVGDSIRGDTWNEEQTTYVSWNSPSEGELKSWSIKEGQVIERDGPCMVVEEACSHEVQFHGLCAMCGKDMTLSNWAAESRDTDRATISMVHDQTNLTVSASHAQRTEKELQRRLLESRRLSLVVDLDQTIIQACIDPTVGEWMKDPSNPNYDSVKDIKTFQLDDGPTLFSRRCWYYIKMRPGLENFLKRMSTMYEMHVYTMGTRAYAQSVAHAVDPDKKLFGNRVISRDENGSIHAKSLQRLFPVSTNMVVIIDDRSDVWPQNRPNLIKVSPYEFFKGIGDINASFLPKRQDLLTSSGPTANGVAKKKKTIGVAAARITSEEEITQEQLDEQKNELEKQIKERPLQLLQAQRDREDEEAEKASVHSEDGSESRASSPVPHRHRVLYDDDEELSFLDKHLSKLHKEFYDAYDKQRAQKNTNLGDSEVPDVGQILDNIKSQVLKGRKIALSGVLPQNIDIYRSEIGLQILGFGAELRTSVTRDLTHLVVNTAQPGKEKLKAARRLPNVKVVSLEWLAQCFAEWNAVDEFPYLYNIRHEGDDQRLLPGPGEESEEDGVADDAADGPKTPANKKRPGLRLNAAARDEVDTDVGDEDQDLMPDDLEDGQMSPIDGLKTFNWGSAEEELNEFLASVSSDDEDEDEDMDEEGEDDDEEFVPKEEGESSLSEDQKRKRKSRSRTASPSRRSASPANRKRKHDASEDKDSNVDTGTESEGTGTETGSPSKKLRRTKSARGSSLRNQFAVSATTDSNHSTAALPTPVVTGDEEDVALLKGGDDEDDEGDGWDEADLEAEFEAGFAAAEEEEQNNNNNTSSLGGIGEFDREKG